MNNYVYTASTTELKKLLNTVKKNPAPPKGVSNEYLLKIGAGTNREGKVSPNAKAARNVIRAMGIIDENNQPTSMWSKARTDFEGTMLEGLKNLYPDEDGVLDHENSPQGDVQDWFKSAVGLADATQKMCVSTFLTIQAAARGEDITPTRKKRTANRPAVKTEVESDIQLSTDIADSKPKKPHHPLIDGLFHEIPKEGETWTQAEQESWFDLAKMVFKQVFKENMGENIETPLIPDSRSSDNQDEA